MNVRHKISRTKVLDYEINNKKYLHTCVTQYTIVKNHNISTINCFCDQIIILYIFLLIYVTMVKNSFNSTAYKSYNYFFNIKLKKHI